MALGEEICTHRMNFVRTCGLFSCFLVTGLSMGVVGPTLLDFKVKTNSQIELVALIFPVRAAGYALGSFSSGLLYDKMDVQVVTTATMALAACLTLAIPFVKQMHLLLANFAAVGVSLGFFSAGGNMWVLDLWGRAHPPFLQAAHFMLALGAFSAPLIARPFLRSDSLGHYSNQHLPSSLNVPEEQSEEGATESPAWTVTRAVHIQWPGAVGNSSLAQIMASEIDLRVPFAVIAGISLANSFFFLAIRLLYPKLKLHPSRVQRHPSENKCSHADGQQVTAEPKVSLVSYTGSFSVTGSFSLTTATTTANTTTTTTNTDTTAANSRKDDCSSSIDTEREDRTRETSPSSRMRESRHLTCHNSLAMAGSTGKRARVTSVTTVAGSSDLSARLVRWWKQLDGLKALVVIMATSFMHIYYGLEITFGTFVTTFCHESPLHLAATEGATVTSVFWATFAFWRLPTIFIVDYFGPIKTVTFNLVILVIGNALLIPWASSHRWALYSGVALIGLGASPIWASMFSVLELYFVVSPAIATAMITASMMGELVFPTVVSRFVASKLNVFLWVALFCSSAVIVLFASIVMVCQCRLNRVPSHEPPMQAAPSHSPAQRRTRT